MTCIHLAEDLIAVINGRCVALQGELQRNNTAQLLEWLDKVSEIETIALDELDITDAMAVIEAVNAVRHILERQRQLCIRGAPQLLAHNLYRTGLLESGHIELLAMREDEAYG